MAISQHVFISFALDDAVLGQDTSRHPLHDLRVVVDLTLVMREDGKGDGANRCPPTVRQQHLQHHRLVDLGHPHLFIEELNEPFVGR